MNANARARLLTLTGVLKQLREDEEDKFEQVWPERIGIQTDKAVLLTFGKRDVWVPLSCMTCLSEGLFVKRWFLDKEGLL